MAQPWTDEAFILAKDLWAKGYSASQISAQLYEQLRSSHSRNAVIGKLSRTGSQKRCPQWQHKTKVIHTTPKPQRHHKLRLKIKEVAPQESSYVEPPIPTEAPPSKHLSLLDLNDQMCHWPYGDPTTPTFHFCGCETTKRPYCQFHTTIAFNFVSERMDRKRSRI